MMETDKYLTPWELPELITDDELAAADASGEAAVHEHADRAGLPATQVTQRGKPLSGE